MSRPGLPSSPYTPVFGIPSVAGIKPPKTPAMPPLGAETGISGVPSLEEALGYISNLSKDLQPEQEETTPYIAFSPSRNELFVNGFTFAENDATRALESEQYLGQSRVRPETGDWQRIPASVYQDYLQSIRDPSAGTRFAKSFSSGVGSLQQLWGAALMAATDGNVGQGLYEAGGARMERLQPFAKKFSEVKNLDDAGDFMVSLLGSQAPNILESITTALIGAGLGAAVGSTGTPVGTVVGGLGGGATGIFAKGAVKNQLKAIANKKLAKQTNLITPDEDALWKREAGKTGMAIRLAAEKKLAGEVLSPDEQKLIRQGAAVTGALTLSTLENYGIGVGDVYGEMIEKGVADEPGARAAAFGYAVPYAALSTAPEFLGALALLRPTAQRGLGAAARRFGTGFAVGAAGEGASEAAQEGLIMGAAEGFGAQYTPQERGERLLEAGVAGALLGGPIGGTINLLSPTFSGPPERAAGLTTPAAPAAPTAPTTPPEGPTLADISDIPPPPSPESILGTPGLRPPPPQAPFPSAGVYEDISPSASYMGGRPEEEEFVGAPPVRPGQEGMFFQDDDLGPIVTPAAEPAAAEPATTFTDENQSSLLTQKGTPRKDVELAAATGALTNEQKKTIRWFTNKGEGKFPLQAATNLATSNGVLVQPDELKGSNKNIKAFTAANDGNTIELQLGSTKEPKRVAYSENLYGSPENFARVMGFDYDIIADGTFVRRYKSGGVSAPQNMAAYKPPRKIKKTQAAPSAAPPAGAKGAALKRGKGKPKDAIQKRTSEKVDVREQPEDGGRVRADDTARDEATGESEAEAAEEKPVRDDVKVNRYFGRKSFRAGAPTKKEPVRQTDIVRRQMGLSPQQKAALLTELGTDAKGMIDILVDDPARANAAIDRVLKDETSATEGNVKVNRYFGRESFRAGAKPAAKAKAKAKEVARDEMSLDERKSTLTTASNKALIEEAEIMTAPEGLKSPKAKYTIEFMKELQQRVNNEKGTDEELKTIGNILNDFSDPKSTTMKTLLEEARKQLDADPTSRASVAPGSLKKNKVKEQTIRDVVDRILSKLSPEARKNTEILYATSMEDLKANNSKLYRDLEKSRSEQGDINNITPAAFYLRKSDGTASIVMFTDNIVDETHATLVFLEEMVSHHGFSTLLGDNLNPFMEKIYDENPEIAAEAEAYLRKNKGVSKAEATEEVIAKELARDIGVELGILSPSAEPSYVPVGILTRLINEIKKLLSKLLGKQTVAFMDAEDVRVLFAKSKQFARGGTKNLVKSNTNFTGTYRGFVEEPRTPSTPMVYHGSPNKVEGDLRPSSSAGLFGPGIYLTTDKERARGYAGINGEVVEMTVPGKLATREQWKETTRRVGEGTRLTLNALAEIDRMAIAELEAKGFVGVQAGDTITVWKAENLKPVTMTSRFSVAPPEDGPKAAERLTPQERAVLGNTTAADVYERASNGETNSKIADDLGLSLELVKQVYNAARDELKNAGIEPRARKKKRSKPTKKELAIIALSTRKADGSFPSVEEVAKEIDVAEATVNAAIKEEREKYASTGRLPEFLVPPEIKGVSRVFEYAQSTSPLYNPQRPTPRTLAAALDWLNDRNINVKQLGRDVLNAVKTMNFSSRSNAGYAEGYRILSDMKNKISELRTKYINMLRDTLALADDKVREDVSRMLQFTTQAKLSGLTDRELKKFKSEFGPLIEVKGNEIIVNPEAFAALSKKGRFTLEEFKRGITREVDAPLFDDAGNVVFKKEKANIPAMPDLTEDSLTWKLYLQVRDAMDEAAIDRVRADYASAFGTRENAFETIQNTSGKKLSQSDKDFILRIDQRYRELSKAGASPDDTGRLVYKVGALAQASEMIADFNRVLIAKDTDDVYKTRLENFAKNFPEKDRAEIKAQIESFRKGMTFSQSNQYDVQRVVSDLAALELGKEDSELYAMRSIAGGYIPIGRKGRWQTRIRVVDPETGQVYGLMDSFRSQLPYFQHENRAEADRLAKEINTLFPEKKATMELPVFDPETKKYVVKKVRLEAVADAARETPSVDPGININEFQRMVVRFGVTLTPEERERIVIGMTEQNAKARLRLQRENTAGQDPNSIPYISEHLETLANITGRRTHQHRTDALLDDNNPQSQRLWNGDPALLKAMEKRLDELSKDPAANEAAIEQLEREFNLYAFQMRRTQEEGGAGVFKDRFVRDLAFLEDQKALEYADFASDGLGQSIRTWTAVAQLGGVFAPAALNVMSLPLNVVPALASYNPETAFGGGFGFPKAVSAVTAAIKDVGGPEKNEVTYYKDLLKNKEALAKSGLTRDEAAFLASEIEFGNLQASMFNALTASAKGKFGSNPKIQKFVETYMSAFTYTEQASRRAAALAAYRLERERLLEADIDPENAQKMAGRFAIDLMDNALGNYAMYNRPGGFRGGLRDFIFMYKMYPITVTQLLSAMPLSGRIAMLVPLVILSGIKGLPGAEDLIDIIDTILQRLLKAPAGSSEKWLADQLNEIAPGLTPYVMRGVVDQIIPATISSRTGMGNLIPGTSIFLSGSNQFREILDVFGPSAAFVEGTISTAATTAQAGLATVGLSGGAPSLTGILRESPVTLLRAVGDTIEYAQVGAIVDAKGYVSSYDLNASTYVSRILGFYPAAATRENDIVRVTKRDADYLREVSGEFRRAYVKAALRNDREGMQRVIERVRDWNEATEDTGLGIPNFAINARRAVQEARKTASERYATSAPKSLRSDIREAQEAAGIE